MDIKDIKNKSEKDLRELLNEKRVHMREMKFKVSESQLKNVRDFRKTRKDIAQILTLINQQS